MATARMRFGPALAPTLNTGTGSHEYVAKMQGLRRSGAAGTHRSKATKRARTRSSARGRAVRRDIAAG